MRNCIWTFEQTELKTRIARTGTFLRTRLRSRFPKAALSRAATLPEMLHDAFGIAGSITPQSKYWACPLVTHVEWNAL
jgi:hypothetical protein